MIAEIQLHLSEQFHKNPKEFHSLRIEPMIWNDTSLGSPKEGEYYLQVLTPGYRILFELEGIEFDVHVDEKFTHWEIVQPDQNK